MSSSLPIPDPQVTRLTLDAEYGLSPDPDGVLAWSWAHDQLTQARNYWLVTASPASLPHAAPVWGVWLDNALCFGSGDGAKKTRNFRANPHVVVHLESGDRVVILNGTVAALDDAALRRRIAPIYAGKYAFPSPDLDVEAQSAALGLLWRFVPTMGMGWLENDFVRTATRWTFAAPS